MEDTNPVDNNAPQPPNDQMSSFSTQPASQPEKTGRVRFNADPFSWSRRSKILGLILCLLLPPIGVFWLLYLFYMSVRKQDWRTKKVLVSAVTVLIVTGIGALAFFEAQYYFFIAPKQYHYTYTKLDDYKLGSTPAGYGINFKKPTEFVESGKPEVIAGASETDLYHPNKQTTPTSSMGYIIASSVQSALAGSPTYVKDFSDIVNNPKDKNYSATVKGVNTFLQQSYNKLFKIDLGPAKQLKTANIKDNAWEFDFSIQNDQNKHKITPLRGEVVLAIGKRAFYYFTASTVDYNWDANQSTWNQVIDSIQIDQ